jgi:diguanylate cyclase (GGDEF)-like protein
VTEEAATEEATTEETAVEAVEEPKVDEGQPKQPSADEPRAEASELPPSAAEELEAPPLEERDVRWDVAGAEGADAEPPGGNEPPVAQQTLPAIELPASLKEDVEGEAGTAPVRAKGGSARPESRAPDGAEADAAEPHPPRPEETAGGPPPGSEPAATPRPPRRRPGLAPVCDEEEFESELAREVSKCRRVDRPLTLILVKVGDLPQIVELFGEEFRERVLWHVAEQAMASLRDVDLVGMLESKERVAMTAFASDRYGGGRIVSRMERVLDKNPIRVGAELPAIVPALRFGMASYPGDGDDVESLLTKAEEDLSSAKSRQG